MQLKASFIFNEVKVMFLGLLMALLILLIVEKSKSVPQEPDKLYLT